MADQDLYCTVVSIVPFVIKEFKPGLNPGYFEIPAATEDEPQVFHVGTGMHNVYIDESRGSLPVKDPSTEIARSIVEDFASSQLEYANGIGPGIFWVIGKVSPSAVKVQCAQELTEAKIRQRRWFEKLVQLADRDWERYKQPNVISDFQRLAARLIQADPGRHSWLEPGQGESFGQCIACYSSIHPKAVICPHCRVVQDESKIKEFKFAQV